MEQFLLRGTQTTNVGANFSVDQDFVDGNVFASGSNISAIKKELSISTIDVETALDLFGTIGTCIQAGSEITIFYAKWDPCTNTAATGSVHRKVTITQASTDAGLIIPKTLNTDSGGDSVYSLEVMPKSDGVNSPISFGENVALPSVSIAPIKKFTLGPTQIDGEVIEGIENVSFQFGLSSDTINTDSDIHSTYVRNKKIEPKVSIKLKTGDWLSDSTMGYDGQYGDHVGNKFILRQRSANQAGFAAATASEHILLTANGVITPSTYYSTSGSDASESAIDIHCHHDGTNVPITATTGHAYAS